MTMCQFCGAYSPRQCELREEAGCCPWEEAAEGDDWMDPDRMREDRDERERLQRDDE